MRKVRCVSPHGGAHHGTDAEGDPVGPGYTGRMTHPPNEGGYVDNAVLGRVAVGAELDAPEPPEFIADGFHFVDLTTGQGDVCQVPGDGCWCGQHRDAPPPDPGPAPDAAPAPAAASSLASLLGKENG